LAYCAICGTENSVILAETAAAAGIHGRTLPKYRVFG
jgi:hypothetical protein